MASNNIPTPIYNSNTSYDVFKKELEIWSKITNIAKDKQGLHVLLSLPGKDKDPAGIKEKLLEECNLELLGGPNGLGELEKLMDKYLLKDTIQDAWDKFQDFEGCEKESGENWLQYITRFDSSYDRVKNKGLVLPASILAFKLLRGSKLGEDERLIVMTGLDLAKPNDMYEDAKASLKKFKGGASSITKNEFKLEHDTFYTSNNSRRGQYRGRFQSQQRGRGRNERRETNPIDYKGRPMRCLCCESTKHLIRDCPHKEGKYINFTAENTDEKREIIPIVMFTRNEDELVLLSKEASSCGVLDSGCASTVCGSGWLKMYFDQLDEVRKSQVVKSDSYKSFQFGGEYRLASLGKYSLPAEILGKPVTIETDVVDSNIPLLFSNKALGVMKAKIDYENDKATIFGLDTILNRTSSGHHCLNIMPDIQVNITEMKQKEQITGKISEASIDKLHKQYGHPGKQSFIMHLKTADIWEGRLQDIIDKLYEKCAICKQFSQANAKPVVALPMANQFNETIAIDLKAWKNIWILYMIDMFSRYTAATLVKRKKPEEIIEAIIKDWIAVFGVMKKILSDNGGEFNSEEIRSVESLLNIEHKTTGAESPFQNGLCERNHAVTDMILCKLQAQYRDTPLNILLKWATMAKNSMQMWAGFSSHQLVFGINPNLPNVMNNPIPALENGDYCKSYTKHIAALHAAREEFVKSEASEKIKRALRHNVRISNQIFTAGEKVFYRKEGRDEWQGPATVIGQDGKVIIIKHGSFVLRTSPSRLMKADNCEFRNENCGQSLYDTSAQSSEELDDTTSNQSILQSHEDTSGNQPNRQLDNERTPTPNDTEEAQNIEGPVHNNLVLRRSLRNFNRENNTQIYSVSIPKNEQNNEACLEAKKEELNRLQQFDVYEEVIDQGQQCISTRWVLVKKGEKTKARLTARGFEEDISAAVDSPTIGKNCVRIVLAIAASKHWKIQSTDIKSAFLQGQPIERDVYLLPPKEANTKKGYIWKLRRYLYGLNDAARQFYVTLAEELVKLGGVKSKMDPSLFSFYSESRLIGILVSHIDDFLHAGDSFFDTIMEKLCERFSAGSRDQIEFKYTGYQLR